MEILTHTKEMSLEEIVKFEKDFKILEDMVYIQNHALSKLMAENNIIFTALLRDFIILNNAKIDRLRKAKSFIDSVFSSFIENMEGGEMQ